MLDVLFIAAVFGAAIWATVSIARSREALLHKAIWCLLVLFVPVIGFLAWLIAGPKSRLIPLQ
ncbi:MAG: PLD nuclease N-terminal domain-containing protein [Pseudomonadota bacterium]